MADGDRARGPGQTSTVAAAVGRVDVLHTICVGSGASEKSRRRVAQSGAGGLHIHADDSDDLAQAFRDIARSLAVVLVE